MSFLTPAALAFAAALPVVVIFYLLKRKRVVKLVSSTLLWQKFLADTQASAPFQRLRHNWLLVLQLLMLALAVFALMRPFLMGQARESRLRVIILDGSASMQATDEKPSRFEKARTEALDWVDGLRDGEQMMILLAAATTEVKQSPTSDKSALRRALQSCAASDSPTRLADALKTAGAFTFEKRGEEEVTSGEIHLFSDGAAPDLDDLSNKNLPLVYHRVGSSGNNAGIVRIDARSHPENPAQRAVFVAIANLSTNARQTDVELLFEGQLLQTRPLTLAPTNTQVQIFAAPQDHDGVFTVRLTEPDDLAADNQASIVSFLPTPLKILLITRGNRFLEKALKAAPNVQLSTALLLADDAAGFDLCVLDDVIPAVWPKVNTLAIHTANTNWFPGWANAPNPVIMDSKNAHPLLRFVSFDNVQIAEALQVAPPRWGIPLLDSGQSPLIVAGEVDRHRLIWIAFDTLQSTWPLRISFPIFMANAVDWLNPSGANASQFLVQSGSAFRLGLTDPVSSAQLTTPDGKTRALPLDPDTRELVIGDTHKQGVYRLKAGTNDATFCVNLMDSNESNIAPREELPLGKYDKVAATKLRRASQELWRWLAAACLFVLLFEWWWYHKRTV